MNTPRFAVAVLSSALAAAPAFSQPLMPVSMGPAGAGQCVLGSEGCGSAGSIMDPLSEGTLMGLGQSMIPPLGNSSVAAGSASGGAAAKKAPSVAPKSTNEEDPGTDLVAIGGQIINPLGGAAALHPANGMNLPISAAQQPARSATFDTHLDGSAIPTPTSAKATGLSYVHSQKVESTIGGNANAFGSDPKLSAGDADFGSGGTRATANGSR